MMPSQARLRSGLIFDMSDQMYPSTLFGFVGGSARWDDETRFTFLLTLSDDVEVKVPQGDFRLRKNMYAAIPGAFALSGTGHAALFQRLGFRGLFSVGGPTEEQGRLIYIDGCSTTLIGPPARDGDPCLNLLYFPPHTEQTSHIHPTLRLGVVTSGSGTCKDSLGASSPLKPGDVFALNAGYRHSFHSEAAGLSVVAYHPDSEGGPTDESHPMLNRTYTNFDR